MTETQTPKGFSWSSLFMMSILFLLAYKMASSQQPAIPTGKKVVSFRGTLLSNNQNTTVSLAHPKTVLYFWATWCGICKAELAQKVSLFKKLKKQGIQVWMLNTDQGVNQERLSQFVNALGIPKEDWELFLFDPSASMTRQFGIRAYPTVVVVENGKVGHSFVGQIGNNRLLQCVKEKH